MAGGDETQAEQTEGQAGAVQQVETQLENAVGELQGAVDGLKKIGTSGIGLGRSGIGGVFDLALTANKLIGDLLVAGKDAVVGEDEKAS